MSYQAVQWALYEAPMLLTASGKPDTAARLVLIARAERADAHGRNTFAGPDAVMRATGYDERTVQRADKRLESAGLLIRDGFSHLGTVRWHIDMTVSRTDTGDAAVAERLHRRRKLTAARQQQFRERRKQSSVTHSESVTDESGDAPDIEGDVSTKIGVTHSDSVTSRTQTALRNALSAPQTTHEPPPEPPSGGTLPPDPLRHQPPTTSGSGTAVENSLSEPLTPAQDQEGESLPQAREDVREASNVIPFTKSSDPKRRAREQGRAEVAAKAEAVQARAAAILARRGGAS